MPHPLTPSLRGKNQPWHEVCCGRAPTVPRSEIPSDRAKILVIARSATSGAGSDRWARNKPFRAHHRRLRQKAPRQNVPFTRYFLKAVERIRTADPFITSEVLYQLSYVGGRAESSPVVVDLGASLPRESVIG